MTELEKQNNSKIKQQSLKAVKWSALAEISSRFVQPIVTLILARLLSPSAFGIVAIATSVAGIAQILQDAGFGKAIIQTDDYVDTHANNAFWMNMGLGFVLYVVIYFTAPFLSQILLIPEIVNVLRVYCLQIVILSFTLVHSALLRRQIRFRDMFVIRMTSSIFPGFISIVVAFWGMGVWSLVYGSLLGSISQLFLYWILSDWRPRLKFDMAIFNKMLGYSKWVLLEGLLGWIVLSGDSIIIGRFLGVNDVGFYRLGVTIIALVSNIFFTPVVNVALSLFSRLQTNLPDLKEQYKKLTQLVVTVSIPVGVGVAMLAKPIVVVLLGEKWIGAEIVIAIMAIRAGLGWYVGLNPTINTAIGRPDINFKVLFINTMITLPAYVIGAQFGLLAFCLARLFTSLIDNIINYFVTAKILGLPLTSVRSLGTPMVCSAIMTLVLGAFMSIVNIEHWFKLTSAVIIGGASFFGCLYLVNKEFVIWGYRYTIQAIKRN